MDLDNELRRLFNDDRLDVHVAPDAEEKIVRGAGRRRRNRAAVAGAFAVVALIGAGVGLSQLRQLPSDDNAADSLLPTATSTPSTAPPQVSTMTQTVTITVDPPATENGNNNGGNNNGTGNNTKPGTGSNPPPVTQESGPGVYGKLKLAMSEKDALATGVLIAPSGEPNPDAACKSYATQSVPDDANAVIISSAKGVVRITLPSFAKTSKNIGAGSKVSELKTAYPSATQNGSELVVQMTATPRWVYVFENDGNQVTKVRMRLADNDCAGA